MLAEVSKNVFLHASQNKALNKAAKNGVFALVQLKW